MQDYLPSTSAKCLLLILQKITIKKQKENS